jgi:hypothetical protein
MPSQPGPVGHVVCIVGNAVAGKPDSDCGGQEDDRVGSQWKVLCHPAGLPW